MSPANWTVVSTLTGYVFQDEDRLPERGRNESGPGTCAPLEVRQGRSGNRSVKCGPQDAPNPRMLCGVPYCQQGDIMMSSGSTSLLCLLFSQA